MLIYTVNIELKKKTIFDKCTYVTEVSNPHLYWQWNYLNGTIPFYILFLITICILFFRFTFPINYILIIFSIISFIFSLYKYKKVLGVGTSGLIGAAQQLLPDVGGNIQNTLNTHLPKTVLDGGNLSQLMTNATKALSLSKMAFNIAKTIFGGSKAQNTADAAAAAASQAQSTGKPVQMSTVDGALIQATPGYSTVA